MFACLCWCPCVVVNIISSLVEFQSFWMCVMGLSLGVSVNVVISFTLSVAGPLAAPPPSQYFWLKFWWWVPLSLIKRACKFGGDSCTAVLVLVCLLALQVQVTLAQAPAQAPSYLAQAPGQPGESANLTWRKRQLNLAKAPGQEENDPCQPRGNCDFRRAAPAEGFYVATKAIGKLWEADRAA